MSRYKKVRVEEIKFGQKYRIIRRSNALDYATMTYEGPVRRVDTERTTGVLGTTNHTMVRGFYISSGTFLPYSGDGWTTQSIEEALPALPHTTGSVVLVDSRAAVLRDIRYEEGDGESCWLWVDNDTRVPQVDLDRAEILHVARVA